MVPTLNIETGESEDARKSFMWHRKENWPFIVLTKLGHQKKKWQVQVKKKFVLKKYVVCPKDLGVFIGSLCAHILSCVFYHILFRSNSKATKYESWDLKNNYKGMNPTPPTPWHSLSCYLSISTWMDLKNITLSVRRKTENHTQNNLYKLFQKAPKSMVGEHTYKCKNIKVGLTGQSSP